MRGEAPRATTSLPFLHTESYCTRPCFLLPFLLIRASLSRLTHSWEDTKIVTSPLFSLSHSAKEGRSDAYLITSSSRASQQEEYVLLIQEEVERVSMMHEFNGKLPSK